MNSEGRENQKGKTLPNSGDKRVFSAPSQIKSEKGYGASGKRKKLPEHDNLSQNLVLGEDSGPMLETSEMLDFSQGADS